MGDDEEEVPDVPDEVVELATFLADVPSFSPKLGERMLQARDDLLEEFEENGDGLEPVTRKTILNYIQALDTVATMSGIHQAATIGKLRLLIEQEETLAALLK